MSTTEGTKMGKATVFKTTDRSAAISARVNRLGEQAVQLENQLRAVRQELRAAEDALSADLTRKAVSK
jgi:hypothetical protein